MASPSDSYAREAAARKQNKAVPFKFLVPLIYARVLSLIRISLRKNPVLRDRLFAVVLARAFAHGFYLAYRSKIFDQNGIVLKYLAEYVEMFEKLKLIAILASPLSALNIIGAEEGSKYGQDNTYLHT